MTINVHLSICFVYLCFEFFNVQRHTKVFLLVCFEIPGRVVNQNTNPKFGRVKEFTQPRRCGPAKSSKVKVTFKEVLMAMHTDLRRFQRYFLSRLEKSNSSFKRKLKKSGILILYTSNLLESMIFFP